MQTDIPIARAMSLCILAESPSFIILFTIIMSRIFSLVALIALCIILCTTVQARVERSVRDAVSSMDGHVKSTVLGLQAQVLVAYSVLFDLELDFKCVSQGVPKDEIAKRIQYASGGVAPHKIIDGINEEDSRNRSPAAMEAKKRGQQRDQAIRQQRREDRRQ